MIIYFCDPKKGKVCQVIFYLSRSSQWSTGSKLIVSPLYSCLRDLNELVQFCRVSLHFDCALPVKTAEGNCAQIKSHILLSFYRQIVYLMKFQNQTAKYLLLRVKKLVIFIVQKQSMDDLVKVDCKTPVQLSVGPKHMFSSAG